MCNEIRPSVPQPRTPLFHSRVRSPLSPRPPASSHDKPPPPNLSWRASAGCFSRWIRERTIRVPRRSSDMHPMPLCVSSRAGCHPSLPSQVRMSSSGGAMWLLKGEHGLSALSKSVSLPLNSPRSSCPCPALDSHCHQRATRTSTHETSGGRSEGTRLKCSQLSYPAHCLCRAWQGSSRVDLVAFRLIGAYPLDASTRHLRPFAHTLRTSPSHLGSVFRRQCHREAKVIRRGASPWRANARDRHTPRKHMHPAHDFPNRAPHIHRSFVPNHGTLRSYRSLCTLQP